MERTGPCEVWPVIQIQISRSLHVLIPLNKIHQKLDCLDIFHETSCVCADCEIFVFTDITHLFIAKDQPVEKVHSCLTKE